MLESSKVFYTNELKNRSFDFCLRDLEQEHARLKQMFADLSLENRPLKTVIEKSSNTSSKEGNNPFSQGRI